MKKKRLISLITAGGLGAGTLAVIAASAQASAPVPCKAGSKHSGTACVLITKNVPSGEVDSVRVNGRCLEWKTDGPNYYYGDVGVEINSTPTVRTYIGFKCEGNTDNTSSGEVTAKWSSGSGKRTNFRRLTISYSSNNP